MNIKVKSVEKLSNYPRTHIVCKGKLVLVETKLFAMVKREPWETGTIHVCYPNTVIVNNTRYSPIIISETEDILVGDSRYDTIQPELEGSLMHNSTKEDLWMDDQPKQGWKKVLARSEHFGNDILQLIQDGEIKDGEQIFIKCEEREPEDHEVVAVGNSVEDILENDKCRIRYYQIALGDNYITVFPAEEGISEIDQLRQDSAELRSLKQSILESNLRNHFPKKEISFHDKVVFAIANAADNNRGMSCPFCRVEMCASHDYERLYCPNDNCKEQPFAYVKLPFQKLEGDLDTAKRAFLEWQERFVQILFDDTEKLDSNNNLIFKHNPAYKLAELAREKMLKLFSSKDARIIELEKMLRSIHEDGELGMAKTNAIREILNK